MIVPASKAFDGEEDWYTIDGADHFSICKPPNKSHMSYQKLRDFICSIVEEWVSIVKISII
jgi:hypothetical protein